MLCRIMSYRNGFFQDVKRDKNLESIFLRDPFYQSVLLGIGPRLSGQRKELSLLIRKLAFRFSPQAELELPSWKLTPDVSEKKNGRQIAVECCCSYIKCFPFIKHGRP